MKNGILDAKAFMIAKNAMVAGIFLALLLIVGKWYFNSVPAGGLVKEHFYGAGTILFAVLLMVLLYKSRDDKAIDKYIYPLWGLLPMITYAIVETINGNVVLVYAENAFKNLLMYYTVYLVLNFILGNNRIAMILFFVAFVGLGLVQYFVFLFRGRSLVIQDFASFKTAMTVAGTYEFVVDYTVFLILVVSIVLLWMFVLWSKRVRRSICLGAALALVVIIGFWNVVRGPFLNELFMWRLESAYSKDGLVLALIESIPYSFQEEPENYSLEMVEAIADSVDREGIREEKKPNILLIMNESFSDLDYLGDVAADEELLPCWKEVSVAENAISGYLNMPVFGAGTANAEYEVLVGNTVHFMPSGSVAYQMNEGEEIAGMASILKEQDYKTIALHPYIAENWNRVNIYENMHFDEFLHELNWGSPQEKVRNYTSDLTVYEKLEELCLSTQEPLFAFAVTMQNHGGYENGAYTETVDLQYETEYPRAEQYVSLLQESDRAYEWLIDTFRVVEEDTLVIMFGDHQAKIEDAFYEELMGKSLSGLEFTEAQDRYVTPFIIWANYDIEEEYDVRMSSNYFGSYILEVARAELPIYNKFLLNLMEEVPIIGMGGICDKNGNWYAWSQLTSKHEEMINQYKILQYNKLYDKDGYSEEIFE